MAIDEEVSTAKATTEVSVPVVIRTKEVVSAVVGLVMVVYGIVTATPELIDAGEVTVRAIVPLVATFEVLVPMPVSEP